MSGTNDKLKIKLFADGANIKEMVEDYNRGIVSGFTTNPTLMRKAGVTNYDQFAKEAIKAIPNLPISFEVFSDDLVNMEREARIISEWGKNVYVKIPVTNTKGESTAPLVKRLSRDGLKLNVTALLTTKQVTEVTAALHPKTPSIISVFAGRIADTGQNPIPIMKGALSIVKPKPNIELLWASTRELLNIIQADRCGCDIITVTPDILKKMKNIGKDLTVLSLETVQMFYDDAKSAGYKI
jgi:transaldolase